MTCSRAIAHCWASPGATLRATEYDLTAPLNQASFAHDYTFQSVVAECRFERGQLARIELRAIEEGYGARSRKAASREWSLTPLPRRRYTARSPNGPRPLACRS